jgi:hypothetical protein
MRDRKRHGSRFLPTATFLALGQALAPCAFGQTAEELLTAHAEALGGRAALAAVKTLRHAGDGTFDSSFSGRLEGRVEMEIVVGERVWRHSSMGTFTTTTVWDGSSAWELGPMGSRTLAGDELRLLEQASLPFLAAGVGLPEGSQVVREGDRELDGVTHHVLRIDAGEGKPTTVYLNPETHLATRLVLAAELPNLGQVEITQDMQEYVEHDGVLFPRRIRVSVPGVFTSETVVDETAVNLDIDPERFEP